MSPSIIQSPRILNLTNILIKIPSTVGSAVMYVIITDGIQTVIVMVPYFVIIQ